jgi:Ribonuclease G/E
VAKSSIYKGCVLGRDERTGQTRVDLGELSGLLPSRDFKPGLHVMVQIRAHDYGRRAPVLSSSITIPGRSAVLLPEPVVRLSTKIKDPETRDDLIALGRRIREHTDTWGILWRTAAEGLTEEELRDEVDYLLDSAQQVHSRYTERSSPGLVFEGTSNADIEFPAEVKKVLDKIRGEIRPTLDRHHFYMSAGYIPLVEFAEMVIEDRPSERAYFASKLEKVVSRDMPRVDDAINIEHVKLDGRNIILARGRVVEVSPSSLLIKRQFRHTNRKLKIAPNHTNNVDTVRDEGDYAITHVIPGALTLVTKYYSRDDQLKGTYVNINTGVELYPSNGNSPSRIRYVDLEIDIVNPVGGKARVIDQHLLKRAVQRGFISQDMANQAKEKAEAICMELSGRLVQ